MGENVAISKGRNNEHDRGNNVNSNTQSHPETTSLDPYETGEYLYTYWGTEPSDVLLGKHVQTQGNELSKTVLVLFNVVHVLKILYVLFMVIGYVKYLFMSTLIDTRRTGNI